MVRLRESATVEFKRQLVDAVKREIIAFANTDGGDLYIGVDDEGIPVGVADPDSVMGGVGDMIRNAVKPDLTAYTTIEHEQLEDESGIMHGVVHVTVLRGVHRPYYLASKGLKPTGVFIRHGVSAVPAGEERIRQMIRDDDRTAFDAATSINQDLTFEYTARIFRRQQLPWGESQQRSLGLINPDGLYTNAALLISDQCQHSVKCAVYQDGSKSRFLARQEFRGSILQQLDEACRYLELNNPMRSDVVGLYRSDSCAYPEPALREALINAVAHRDYDCSGPTLVSIFSDRIDFTSLGGLVKGLTLMDLTNGISQPRNAVLANTLYRLRLIESYGSGIPRIMEEYAGNSTAPAIRVTPGAFTITLPRLDHDGGDRGAPGSRPAPGTGSWFTARNPFPAGPVIRTSGETQTAVLSGYPTGEGAGTLVLVPAAGTTGTAVNGGADPIEDHPSSTLEELTLELIARSGSSISRLEIQQRLGINKNRAAYVLRKLEHEGSIVSTGAARNTRYAVAQ